MNQIARHVTLTQAMQEVRDAIGMVVHTHKLTYGETLRVVSAVAHEWVSGLAARWMLEERDPSERSSP